MIQIKEIARGFLNLILDAVSDLKYKSEFDERYSICTECEHDKNGICEICHCILKAKTKSEDSECPEGKWKRINI